MDRKKIIGFAFGPIASALLGLITVPVIAWNFNPEDVARMNIFQVVVSLFLLLTVLGLDQAYVREYHEVNNKQQLLLASFMPGFLLLFFISIPISFYAGELSLLLYQINDPVLCWITLGVFFISYISRFLSLILRMQERGWAYSVSLILPKIIQLLLLALLSYTAITKEFMHLQLISVGALLSVMLLYCWNTRAEFLGALKQKIVRTQINTLLHFGTPLIFSGLVFWGLTATGTVALQSLSTLEELAIYSVANSFAAVGVVFQSIFTVVWAPTVYKWVSEGVDMAIIDKILMQALAVVCAIMGISGTFSWVIDCFLPEYYSQVKYILLCLLIQPLFYTLSEITCVGIAIKRKNIYSVGIVMAAMLVNFLMTYWLVPLYGAAGAAIANAIAFFSFFVGRTEVSSMIWRKIPKIKLYLICSTVLIISILNIIVESKFGNLFSVVWFIALVVIIYLFLYEFKYLFNLLLSR